MNKGKDKHRSLCELLYQACRGHMRGEWHCNAETLHTIVCVVGNIDWISGYNNSLPFQLYGHHIILAQDDLAPGEVEFWHDGQCVSTLQIELVE